MLSRGLCWTLLFHCHLTLTICLVCWPPLVKHSSGATSIGGSQNTDAVQASAAAAAVDATSGGGSGDGALSEAVSGLDTINNAQTLLAVFNIDSSEFTAR